MHHEGGQAEAQCNTSDDKTSQATVEETPLGDSTNPSRAQSKGFLVTRFVQRVLPASFTTHDTQEKIQYPQRHRSPWRLVDYVFYSSIFRLLWACASGRLVSEDDFPALPAKRKSEHTLQQFQAVFTRVRERRHPLLRAILIVFRRHIIEGILCQAIWAVTVVCQVLIYKVIIEYLLKFYHVEGPVHHGYGEGALYVLAAAGALFFASILATRGGIVLSIVGGRCRMVIAAAITAKTMTISPHARRKTRTQSKRDRDKSEVERQLMGEDQHTEQEEAKLLWTQGAVLNLCNTDVERLQLALQNVNHVWPALVAGPLVIGLSYWLIGWPGPASFGVALLLAGGVLPLLRSTARVRRRTNIATDIRVTKVTDLIHGVRLLKAFAWEDVYAELVRGVRRREARLNQGRVARAGLLAMLCEYMGRAPPVLGVALYAITKGLSLSNSSDVLVYALLLHMLSSFMPLISIGVVPLIDAWLSIQRIEEYLLAEDFPVEKDATRQDTRTASTQVDTTMSDAQDSKEKVCGSNAAIQLNRASFSWLPPIPEDHAEKQAANMPAIVATDEVDAEANPVRPGGRFVLQPITLDIMRGELIAIVGATSSGKSSLAAGIACHMPLVAGSVKRCTIPIYAPAATWIRSATIRENIIFYLPFVADKYHSTIDACGLTQDLGGWAAGDQTVLGERGITLSGGQIARVGMARLMYNALLANESGSMKASVSDDSKASDECRGKPLRDCIVVMDDPLSALDAKVGEAVFDDAILKGMSHMTRVLVTHQVRVLHRCDRIVWLENGKICAVDTFDALMETSPSFRQFVGKGSRSEAQKNDTEVITAAAERSQNQNESGALMLEEERKHDRIPWQVYAAYLYLPKTLPIVLGLLIAYVASQVGNHIWGVLFAWWTGQEYNLNTAQWVGILCGAILAHFLLWQLIWSGVQSPLTTCSRDAGNRALQGVLKAPIAFFDTTPMGRIINRFTQDLNTLDTVLPFNVWILGMTFFNTLATVGFTIYFVPLVATLLVPWILSATALTLFYRPTPLTIKRIEAPLGSRVIAHISELVEGATTLRTSPLGSRYLAEELNKKMDAYNRVHLVSFECEGWVTMQSNLMSCVIYLALGLFAINLRRSVLPGVLAALMNGSYHIVRSINGGIESTAQIQRGANCIERLAHYEHDIGAERSHGAKTPKSWPSEGVIEMQDVSMRYRPGLPLALKGLSLRIEAGEKIGIVGRTGAGKSSVFNVLLGLTDPCGGRILIDGVDINRIGVHDLRNAVAVIPQEPTLFAGTVRSNLDPKGEHSDADVTAVLLRCGLLAPIQRQGHESVEAGKKTMPVTTTTTTTPSPQDPDDTTLAASANSNRPSNLTISTRLSPGGSNLSTGQRQLLSLARALLRRTRILLIDEATAGVDLALDGVIQRMLRGEGGGNTDNTSDTNDTSEPSDTSTNPAGPPASSSLSSSSSSAIFHRRTVLTIAHRIGTIRDYDRVVVVDDGGAREVGAPRDLWDRAGVFRELCVAAGVSREALRGGA